MPELMINEVFDTEVCLVYTLNKELEPRSWTTEDDRYATSWVWTTDPSEDVYGCKL